MKKEIEVREEEVILTTEKKNLILWNEDIRMIIHLIEAEATRLSQKSCWTKTEPAKAYDLSRIAQKLKGILD